MTMVTQPKISVLARDPDRKHRINGNSFQQHAITTIHGCQYVVFYTDVPASKRGACYANIARRQVAAAPTDSDWETVTFEDYEQVVDDGHNTISVGVCSGDGTIHLGFDHHCDRLRFRISQTGVAGRDAVKGKEWDRSKFGATQDFLPGIEHNKLMDEVTYPTFVNVGDDLLLSYRIGQAGQGSDILFHYSSKTHRYTYRGQHLTGIANSPYINGIDYRLARLHISWCYRNVIAVPASTLPDAHKQQAGPNGPENNRDLNYAFSDDLGVTWRSSHGAVVASLDSPNGEQPTINPDADGVRVFDIPPGSGILNQEAQCADWEGGFWVLNRENTSGEEKWVVYHRSSDARWERTTINADSPPTETGNRASICVSRTNDVILVLPGNTDSSLTLLRARKKDAYKDWQKLWSGDGFDGEPCVDLGRLETADILSVFTRREDGGGARSVVVLDFDVSEGAGGGC